MGGKSTPEIKGDSSKYKDILWSRRTPVEIERKPFEIEGDPALRFEPSEIRILGLRPDRRSPIPTSHYCLSLLLLLVYYDIIILI